MPLLPKTHHQSCKRQYAPAKKGHNFIQAIARRCINEKCLKKKKEEEEEEGGGEEEKKGKKKGKSLVSHRQVSKRVHFQSQRRE